MVRVKVKMFLLLPIRKSGVMSLVCLRVVCLQLKGRRSQSLFQKKTFQTSKNHEQLLKLNYRIQILILRKLVTYGKVTWTKVYGY